VLPSDKREVVSTVRNEFGLVIGMTGDGVNDAPALSVAQVGIAVFGATDAAKNAADLILTEPGLKPIYGAILESRRIFARIKAYVVYRISASIILVLTLSIVVVASGCNVNTLYVIILALMNDISMIPVAYDKAKATTNPQLPETKKLIEVSLYYGLVQTVLGLGFIYLMHYFDINDPINLERRCSSETQGFIWYHLVLVTEMMIFSVRVPYFFINISMIPSIFLIMSVALTCIVGALISIFAMNLSTRNFVWITTFNIGTLVLVDIGKIWFEIAIGDTEGEMIASDDLIEAIPMTDTAKHLSKMYRYKVHEESVLPISDRQHKIIVRRRTQTGLGGLMTNFRESSISDGFINNDGRYRYISGVAVSHPISDTHSANRKGRYRHVIYPLVNIHVID